MDRTVISRKHTETSFISALPNTYRYVIHVDYNCDSVETKLLKVTKNNIFNFYGLLPSRLYAFDPTVRCLRHKKNTETP